MAARGAAAGRKLGKTAAAVKVDHGNKMFTHIPAHMAHPGPPLGSQLGQVIVTLMLFPFWYYLLYVCDNFIPKYIFLVNYDYHINLYIILLVLFALEN
jgi:hypothetical protein